MCLNFPSIRTLLAGAFLLGTSLGFAESQDSAADPSLRTWTNKTTGTTVEARPIALNMKTVKLVTTAKKPITMPLEKLSDEDRTWLEEHKDVIGKPLSEWSSTPSGPLAALAQDYPLLEVEVLGAPQADALAMLHSGRAQLALVGTLHHDLTLPAATFGQILRKELNIVGSWMNYSGPWPGEEWQTATRLLTEKRLQLAPLIAHRGDAESFARAVQALNGAPMQGKILLKLS